MMESTVLEQRIETLERTSRRLTALLAALGALVFLGAFAYQETIPDELRARRISMVDAQGQVRAELGLDEEGSAGLFVRDVEGRPRAIVVHDESQSALYLLDEQGTIRLGSAQFAHGGGGYALHGPQAKGSAVLYLKDEGSLTFYGEDGAILERIASR